MKGLAILLFISLTSLQAFCEDFINYDTGIETVKDFIREGELRKAEDLLRRIVHQYPDNPEALSMLARILFWRRDFDKSIEVYQQILQQEDDSSIKAELEKVRVAKILGEAELMIGRGETAEARRLLEELFDSGREQYESGYKLGILYIRTREYEKARDIFERLRALYPDDVGFNALYVESLILNGDIEKANLELFRSGEKEKDYITKERADLFYRVKKNHVCLRGSFYDYTKGIKNETDLSLEIAQRIKEMTLVLSTESISRFGLHDDQVTLQVYSKIGEKTRQWGYLSLSFSPNADFLPKTTIGGEFFQGYRWMEFSAGYMRMNFRETSVDILIPGLIMYLPHGLSLSERLYYVPRNGSVSLLSTLFYEPNHKFRGFYSISIGKSAERIMSIVDLVKLMTIANRLKRLTATERLGYFRLPEMKDSFHYLLGIEKDNEVIVRTILALSMIATDEADFRMINRFLKNPHFMSSKFNEYIYTHIIRSILRNGQSDLFLGFLKSLRDDGSIPVFLKRDIIEACGSEKFHPAKDTIIDFFTHFSDTPEMKITCIRALGKMGGEDVCRIILSSLDDQDWRVRTVAAKHAYLCSLDIIQTLRRCLQDESYYVRINAATSLSRFGEQGISALREEMQSPDRFTRDVSRYIVSEASIYA